MKIGLRAKFCFIFLIFGAALLTSVWMLLNAFAEDVLLEQYADSIDKIVEVTAYRLDLTSEEMETYVRTKKTDARYEEVLAQLNRIREISDLEYVYIVYPIEAEKAVWLFDASGEYGEKLGDPVDRYMMPDFDKVREIYRTGVKSSSLEATETELGRLASFYYPVKDENGKTVAVLGADKSLNDIYTLVMEKVMEVGGRLVLMVAAGMLVLLLFVQFAIIRSIRILKQGVQRMADGERSVRIASRRRDEIGDITAVFNRMSESISRHITEMEELNGAYQKFVPPETFEILHKDSVVKLHLGDQANTSLAILSIEPEAFAEVTQDMSSEETFRYINGILEKTVPSVVKENGTIERFEKAGLCALYRNSAEHALRSAIYACELARKDGGKLAAGIAQGPVMVGVAGHSRRMEIISISEQEKLSAFLMELAEKYHASIFISKSAAEKIEGLKQNYHCRYIGYLKITAADRMEGIVDVFDGDETESRRFKQITKDTFERGVRLFAEENYREARNAFIEVLKQYRKDEVAREYLYRCSQYLQEPEMERNIWFQAI